MHLPVSDRCPRVTDFPTRVLDALVACAVPVGATVAVGVSGGVDSVVLVRTLHVVGVRVAALHVDHGLRPDSGDDARFVSRLADEIGVPSVVRRVTVASGNRAAEARRARYEALSSMAREASADTVAVAHTATDQAETVLMALVRGAGLDGLGGMAPHRALADGVALVRPLLGETRASVEAHARANGWAWRDDPSNTSGVRGRIRHGVLPLLDAEGGPDTARRIAHAAAAVRAARPAALLDAFARPGRRVSRSIAALPAEVRSLIWAEALARWHPAVRRSSALVARLDGLLDAPRGRRVASSGLDAVRERDAVRIGATET